MATILGAKVQQKMHIRKYLSKKNLFLGKKCTGGGNGGMTEKLPPQAPLPPCCVNKNGALIFREKTIRNGFLRTFRRAENVCAESPWE